MARTARGYRLMVLNTNDRDYALKYVLNCFKNFLNKNLTCGFQILT